MDKIIKIYPTPSSLAEEFALELIHMINESAQKHENFTIALSGGSTPEYFFRLLGEKYAKSIPWKFVQVFWGDERCVPPDDSESNFGMTKKTLLSKIEIPSRNIHRIKGEDNPETEAPRYAEEISHYTANREGIPLFDLILLGLGEDGHTASIFPGHMELFESGKICEVAVHPATGQKRITLTGTVINNAETVIFLVTGTQKENVVQKILKNYPPAPDYPAYYIVPVYGRLYWYLDNEAGRLL